MQNLLWKVILILVVVALCLVAVYPPEQKIRLGKDLRGGTSLIYTVSIPPGTADRQGVLNQTIEALKERVNPKGVLDISMLPIGADRIEIVMPLPNEKVKELRKEFQNALAALIHASQIKPGELDQALRENRAVERYAGDGASEHSQKIASLQEAYNRTQAAEQALKEARAANADKVQIAKAEQALADARFDYETLRDSVRKASLDDARVTRTLNLPTTPQKNEADPTAPPKSPREGALENLKAEFPHLASQIDKTVAAYDAYQSQRTTLDDPDDLMRLLRGAGVLEFRIAVQASSPQGVNIDDMRKELAEVGPDRTTSDVAKWFPINDIKQWAKDAQQVKALETDPVSYFGGRNMVGASYDNRYYVLLYTTKSASMTHDAENRWTVESTSITQDRLGRPAVAFRLDTAGGNMMSRLTGPHVHEPMAIVLDGQVYSAPNLNSAIGNSGVIEGEFSRSELDYLTRVLAAGALGARLSEQPIAINTLGPSVGEQNLERGMKACLLSVVAVGIFMIVYYFAFGLVADIALLLNAVVIFGVMALMEASFTLPGLAGVALTCGMAVDANVLIYERIREEIQAGLDLRSAIRIGYRKAFSAIFDGHVTSILVSVALYMTATTEVKGFAVTMIIGLTASLFTALFVTRTIFSIMLDVFNVRHLSMLTLKVPAIQRLMHPNIDWVGLRKYFITASVIACVASVVLVYMRGAEMLDTEFRGGVSAVMHTARTNAEDPNSERKWLPQTGPDGVETRLRKIGEHADPSQVPDPSTVTDPAEKQRLEALHRDMAIRHEVAHALVLTVGDIKIDDGIVYSQSFRISVANPKGISSGENIRDDVVSLVVNEFEKDLDVTKPLQFDGAGTDDYQHYTYPLYMDTLGENLNQRQLNVPVGEYRGGVAVLVQNISPPVTTNEIDTRVTRMREQPDFADVSGRSVSVVGVTPAPDAPGKFTSVAVLVSDPSINAAKVDMDVFNTRMAEREWKLISESLQHQTSLEQVSVFSSAVADTLSANAVVAITLSLLGILVYLWIRFGSIRYADGAILALVHDVILCLGAIALSQIVSGSSVASVLLVEGFRINLDVVAALLTVTGYSVNDTIVVMDRIRENRGKLTKVTPQIVNDSINQTLSRTFLTSGTVLLSVIVLYIVGGPGLRGLSFSLLIGVVTGTYSTVAIASPLVIRSEREHKPEGTIAAEQRKKMAVA